MGSCQRFAPKPSPLLALIALGLVHRFQPAWLAVDLAAATRTHGVSPQRVSRLVTRALGGVEAVVGELTRRGRPPRDPQPSAAQAELARTRALLEVAATVLARVPLRRRAVQTLLVGAWQRLRAQHGLTQEQFCLALALSPRTLRSWLAREGSCPHPASATLTAPEPASPRRPRPPRRPRFGFDVLLPETQFAADTTPLQAFGVPLQLVAAQDLGGRDSDLLEAVLVDDHESAELVIRVVGEALAAAPGAQLLTDQGTPYLAQATREALECLEVEPAPQREGDPRGKSPLERAFRTVKSIAAPLLTLTDRLAAALPALRDAALAQAAARLVLTALLRAYQAGARATRTALDARAGLDLDTLTRAAENAREQARATERSQRLLLAHVHALYDLPRAPQTFVNALRRYPLAVLHKAERAFRAQVHRHDLRDRASYFAALVRYFYDEYRAGQVRAQQERAHDEQIARERAAVHAEREALRADPVAWLRQGFELLALAWQPPTATLLFGGRGPGRGTLRLALQHLVELFGSCGARDTARAAFHHFQREHQAKLGDGALAAIETVFEQVLSDTISSIAEDEMAPRLPDVILQRIGENRRPPPPDRLRN
jgi:transposase InsO family protein